MVSSLVEVVFSAVKGNVVVVFIAVDVIGIAVVDSLVEVAIVNLDVVIGLLVVF